MLSESLRAAHKARIENATARAARLAPLIKDIQAVGITSLRGIAAALNARGVRTPWGHRRWHPIQVARLLKRMAE
jgi:hypothetical protein